MGLAFAALAGCSSDLGDGGVTASRSGAAASATGADGYPNINVDTARRLGGRVRSPADQGRLEAELMALGEQQRAGADAHAPASVIGELQDLGRRSKRDAETLIESGAAPSQP